MSLAPLLRGTDLSGHSPGNIPKQQEGFLMEGVDPTQLLPQQSLIHVNSSEETQDREKIWLLANPDFICVLLL